MKNKFFLSILFIVGLMVLQFSCKKGDNNVTTEVEDKWMDLHAPNCGTPEYINFVNANSGCVLGRSSNNGESGDIILKTNDGGKTWQSIFLSEPFLIETFGSMLGGAYPDPDDSNTLYAAGNNGLFRSTDNGIHWEKTSIYNKLETNAMHFFNPVDGITLIGTDISKTTDSGKTWQTVYKSDAFAFSFNMLQFTSRQTGYVAGRVAFDATNFGMMAKTTDGGNTWKQIDYPFHDILSMCFINDELGYVSMNMDSGNIAIGYSNGSKLLKTQDGGNTWTDVTPPSVLKNKEYIYDLYFKNKLEGFCTFSGIIYHSADGGKTWQKEHGKLIYYKCLTFPDSHTGYAIDTTNTVLKREF